MSFKPNELRYDTHGVPYPPAVRDISGKALADTGLGETWAYRNFVDTPDPRYRQMVKWFADAGYLAEEKDEYAAV